MPNLYKKLERFLVWVWPLSILDLPYRFFFQKNVLKNKFSEASYGTLGVLEASEAFYGTLGVLLKISFKMTHSLDVEHQTICNFD